MSKTGGRRLGTLNKKSSAFSSEIERAGMDIPTMLAELYPKLEASKQADVLLGLMSYLYPKRKPVDSGDRATEDLQREELERNRHAARALTKLSPEEARAVHRYATLLSECGE